MSSLEQVKYEPALYYTDREGFHYNLRWSNKDWEWNIYGPAHPRGQVLAAGTLGRPHFSVISAFGWLIDHKEELIREDTTAE